MLATADTALLLNVRCKGEFKRFQEKRRLPARIVPGMSPSFGLMGNFDAVDLVFDDHIGFHKTLALCRC